MRVPVVHVPHVGLDDGNSSLDKPSRQKQRLPEEVAAVAVSDLVRLLLERESSADLAGRQHCHGFVLLSAELAPCAWPVKKAALSIDFLEQTTTIVQPSRRKADRQLQIVYAEGGLVRILLNVPRIVPGSQQTRVLSGEAVAVVEIRGEHDAIGDAVAARRR